MTDSQKDTLDHIDKVDENIKSVTRNLTERRYKHDESKLEEPELSGYEGLSQALKGLTYGTPEHRAAFEPYKNIIKHHYARNAHHPEHWPNGVTDMSLLDIIEMLCDWKAANDRNNGDFVKSLEVSFKRFGIDGQLRSAIANTAIELGWIPVHLHGIVGDAN